MRFRRSSKTWDQSLAAYYRRRNAQLEAAAKKDIERVRQEEQAEREAEQLHVEVRS